MKNQKINDPYDVELDEYEQDIVDNFDKHIELEPQEKQRRIAELVEAAKNYNEGSSRISIPNPYIAKLKSKAIKLGIPYRKYIIDTLKSAC
jgi:predicted DNA binding CopG/RHH family protein